MADISSFRKRRGVVFWPDILIRIKHAVSVMQLIPVLIYPKRFSDCSTLPYVHWNLNWIKDMFVCGLAFCISHIIIGVSYLCWTFTFWMIVRPIANLPSNKYIHLNEGGCSVKKLFCESDSVILEPFGEGKAIIEKWIQKVEFLRSWTIP